MDCQNYPPLSAACNADVTLYKCHGQDWTAEGKAGLDDIFKYGSVSSEQTKGDQSKLCIDCLQYLLGDLLLLLLYL